MKETRFFAKEEYVLSSKCKLVIYSLQVKEFCIGSVHGIGHTDIYKLSSL
jgi:hypothetical protein